MHLTSICNTRASDPRSTHAPYNPHFYQQSPVRNLPLPALQERHYLTFWSSQVWSVRTLIFASLTTRFCSPMCYRFPFLTTYEGDLIALSLRGSSIFLLFDLHSCLSIRIIYPLLCCSISSSRSSIPNLCVCHNQIIYNLQWFQAFLGWL